MSTRQIAIAALLIIAAGVGMWRVLSPSLVFSPVAGPLHERVSAPAAPKVMVKIARVWQERIDQEVGAVGTLAANEAVLIRPEIAGRIQTIHFREGTNVRAGDPLFVLNTDESRAALAQSEAQQELDRQNFERVKEMRQRNLASAQQYDEVSAKLKYSNASVEKERVRLEKLVIRAPFNGVVGLRRVSVGDYVKEGDALVNFEALNPVKLDFKVPEKYAGSIRTGLVVTVSVEAFADRSFKGEIYAIDPRLDEATRTLQIRARIPNENLLLRPGMFTRVRLGLRAMRDANFIPEQALMLKGSTAYVFRVIDGKAALSPVTTGRRRKGSVEILAGLAAGDSVVTDGQTKLRDGMAVATANPDG